MKIYLSVVSIIVLFLAFTALSCGQENDQAKVNDELSLVGKTFTYEDDDEEIKFDFHENGMVVIYGSEFGDRVEGSYTQDEEDILITIGDEKIYASFDGNEFDLEEPEYFPPGYNITSVGVDAYEARKYVGSDGDSIQYRLFIPEDYDENTKFPLVLFLHGAGGIGNDNIRNLKGPCTTEWAGPERQAANPCFIVAPQMPLNGGKKTKSKHAGDKVIPDIIQTYHKILDELEDEFSIDKNREYVTGISMGGTGTWMSIIARPNRFAAAVPVCGNKWLLKLSAEERGEEITRLPIWIFHGEMDPLISVEYPREIVKTLKAAGGNPKYTEYPGVGHDSWSRAYRDSELIDWLFAQSR